MGSIIYSFLNDSLLFDPQLMEEDYESVSESELLDELRKYREFCLSHWDELVAEVQCEEGRIQLFAGSSFDKRLVKQAAFYLDTIVFTDPLFAEACPVDEASIAWSSFFKAPKDISVNQRVVAAAARQLFDTRSLVAVGYLRYFPNSYYQEPPENIPIYYSPTGFQEVLPPHILSKYAAAAEVRSVQPSPKGLLVMKELRLGRRIHVAFDPQSKRAFGYNLAEQEVIAIDKERSKYSMAMHVPDTLPSRELFDQWVAQSVNRSAAIHFNDLLRDVKGAYQTGAHYLTDSRFNSSILETIDPKAGKSITSTTASGVLNLTLPYFQNASMANLMAARQDGVAFNRFRRVLERNFRELRLENDEEARRIKSENAMHELLDVQHTELAGAFRRLKSKAMFSLTATGFGLAVAIPTSGFSLLASIPAAISGYQTLAEYWLAKKENPAYFTWKAGGGR